MQSQIFRALAGPSPIPPVIIPPHWFERGRAGTARRKGCCWTSFPAHGTRDSGRARDRRHLAPHGNGRYAQPSALPTWLKAAGRGVRPREICRGHPSALLTQNRAPAPHSEEPGLPRRSRGSPHGLGSSFGHFEEPGLRTFALFGMSEPGLLQRSSGSAQRGAEAPQLRSPGKRRPGLRSGERSPGSPRRSPGSSHAEPRLLPVGAGAPLEGGSPGSAGPGSAFFRPGLLFRAPAPGPDLLEAPILCHPAGGS